LTYSNNTPGAQRQQSQVQQQGGEKAALFNAKNMNQVTGSMQENKYAYTSTSGSARSVWQDSYDNVNYSAKAKGGNGNTAEGSSNQTIQIGNTQPASLPKKNLSTAQQQLDNEERLNSQSVMSNNSEKSLGSNGADPENMRTNPDGITHSQLKIGGQNSATSRMDTSTLMANGFDGISKSAYYAAANQKNNDTEADFSMIKNLVNNVADGKMVQNGGANNMSRANSDAGGSSIISTNVGAGGSSSSSNTGHSSIQTVSSNMGTVGAQSASSVDNNSTVGSEIVDAIANGQDMRPSENVRPSSSSSAAASGSAKSPMSGNVTVAVNSDANGNIIIDANKEDAIPRRSTYSQMMADPATAPTLPKLHLIEPATKKKAKGQRVSVCTFKCRSSLRAVRYAIRKLGWEEITQETADCSVAWLEHSDSIVHLSP